MDATPPAVAERLIEFKPALLVIDDEAYICSTIERVFDRKGIKVYKAYNALEGLERLSQVEVQVVISDYYMPGHDGVWLLSQVRELYPTLQRILLTAGDRASVDNLSRSINEAGVHRFVSKPWSNDSLVRTIQECIDQWRVLAERARLQEMLAESNRSLELKVAHRTRDLARASREWRRSFDAIADPMTIIDADRQIRRANMAAANLAQVEIRALLGRKCHEALFERTTPCENCPLGTEARARSEAASTNEMTDPREGRIWKINTWPLVEQGEISDPEDTIAVCHYEDVTQARELQTQMVMLEKIAAVGELAGCVAHELNNPLTGILTFSQLLSRMTEGGDADAYSMSVEIEEAARRCRNIVQALLDYSRPAGQVDFADLNLSEVLDGVVRLAMVSQAAARRVELRREEPEQVVLVRGNLDGLKSVFFNLVNNAIQAMDGTGVLRIRIEPLPDEHLVKVSVQDTGPGIPPALREKIFKPFFTTKAQNKSGTGLGLAIVRNVVRDHGGSVVVGDAPGGGASFEVRLPSAMPKGVP